jgi:hypothetical protein
VTRHLLDTYESEIAKVAAVWPHPKSSTVGGIMKYELRSGLPAAREWRRTSRG